MSLNWDLSECEDSESMFVDAPADMGPDADKVLDGLTHCLIFCSMATGLGKDWSLDESFAPEFYARLRLLDKVNGPLCTQNGERYEITPQDVARHIGMKVNVSPKTRAAFLKTLRGDLDSYARRYVKATAEVEQGEPA